MAELRDYQIEDLAVAIKNPKSLNMSEPGTGKTPIFCALSWYYWTKLGKKTIIVQPNHLRDKNRLEVLRFSGFKPEEVQVLEKPNEILGPKKRKSYPRANQETGFIDYIGDPNLKVMLVGFTFLKRFWKEMVKAHPEIDLVVVDEGHLGYKTYNSNQTVQLYELMDRTSGFYYCTGTIIDGRLDTAFAPIHIVQPKYYGSYEGFRRQHVAWEDDYGKVQAWMNEDKVTKILDKMGVLRRWEDVHGKQERNYIVVDDLPMSPKMEEAYREFEALAFVELDGMLLDGENPGVATVRARQILNCPHMYGIDEKTPKQQYLEGVAEPGTVVFCSMPEEAEAAAKIMREAGLSVGVMHGGVSRKKRVEIDKMYNDGTLDAICATYAVASTGWNWQRTKNMVLMSMDYLDSDLEQAMKRGERAKRDRPLNIYVLEYGDSVDQKVKAVVLKKENLKETVMKGVKGL